MSRGRNDSHGVRFESALVVVRSSPWRRVPLLKRKQSGTPIEAPAQREPAKVINLMDALRRNVEAQKPSQRRQAPRGAAARSRRPASRRAGGRARKAG
jgi:hypothetical protein